jgi:hypothetical protein
MSSRALKFEMVRWIDKMNLGDRYSISLFLLAAIFGDGRDIYCSRWATAEQALLRSLIGGCDGEYTLRKDRRGCGYILSRVRLRHWLAGRRCSA